MVKLTRTPRERRAEVDELQPRDGLLLLLVSLAGAAADQATVVLTARDGRHPEMRLPADLMSGRFQARLPLQALATARTAPEWVWDLYLDLGTGGEFLRLVGRPDGVTGTCDAGARLERYAAGVRVKPFFTTDGSLSIACVRESGR
ncbi:hypothetical protein [Streptomyces sp. CdTB01]|uniref:hypothetical protein n=1 Tax=Streptomyces sp. CdTB01 TaxID=1725411 RepID=UPI00073A712D|nr:hypothetical protein [Streptomyces sp. CdTB01]ALV39187.1 hypothetical protein AS200_44585 [Streptomyces sp. CdTB01]